VAPAGQLDALLLLRHLSIPITEFACREVSIRGGGAGGGHAIQESRPQLAPSAVTAAPMLARTRPDAPKSCDCDGVGDGGVATQARHLVVAVAARSHDAKAFDGVTNRLANLRTPNSCPLYCSAYLLIANV
jgi:hypothetical protein